MSIEITDLHRQLRVKECKIMEILNCMYLEKKHDDFDYMSEEERQKFFDDMIKRLLFECRRINNRISCREEVIDTDPV